MLYSDKLSKAHRKKNFLLHFLTVGVVLVLYIANSCYIKPMMDEKSFFGFIMINFFNDMMAGVVVVSLANIISIIFKRRYIKHSLFYVVVCLFECLVWEVFRPYVLSVINPFHKNPKFLWGDCIAYAVGTLLAFMFICIVNRRNKSEP